ncbi:MAG TPA: 3-phosphoserine/phosphohydroxythreonine transaminase [candidate division Zixibacteria bacterium]|nr:3-phosphoserine/phosphohydroxythreonine transaminase [candidate division Zixibacteria bacterium]
MSKRVFNFNPGPACLPFEVLKRVQDELLDYKSTGMSVMEISHRSKEYDEINDNAIALTRELLGLDDSYHVLFLGGGASTQFAVIPMNFLHSGKTAAYVDTGAWSAKAIKEAQRIGNVQVAASSKETKYDHIPGKLDVPADAAYLHVTSNNTIYGTQYQSFPDPGKVPYICDMSSDILSRRREFSAFDMIYAGAQKNLGPAGVTLIVLKQGMLDKCSDKIPAIFDYRTHAKKKSLYNTPPVFAVYIYKLILEWIKLRGGLTAVEKVNMAKQERIYQMIDLYPDFYRGTVKPDSRSWMNITFRLPSEELEQKFVLEAKGAGMVGLKGHRDVGGIRVSLYNAVPLEAVDKLVGFMETFKKEN